VRCGETTTLGDCGGGVVVGVVVVVVSSTLSVSSLSDNGDGVEYNVALEHSAQFCCCILGCTLKDSIDLLVPHGLFGRCR
jgi:hypothetical protein